MSTTASDNNLSSDQKLTFTKNQRIMLGVIGGVTTGTMGIFSSMITSSTISLPILAVIIVIGVFSFSMVDGFLAYTRAF